jgi:hypothetical protein
MTRSPSADHTRSSRSSITCWLMPLSFFPISKTFSISTGPVTGPRRASSPGQPRVTTPLSKRYWVSFFGVHLVIRLPASNLLRSSDFRSSVFSGEVKSWDSARRQDIEKVQTVHPSKPRGLSKGEAFFTQQMDSGDQPYFLERSPQAVRAGLGGGRLRCRKKREP